MKRLIADMGENSPASYDQIYFKRKEQGIDSHDLKRWKKLLRYYRGGRLLDMGCLDSLVPHIAKRWYPQAEAWGIDNASQAINDMAERFPHIFYQVGDVYDTKFPPNHFAYVVAGELIEHLDDPKRFIKESMRILKHGGILAISTPLEETHAGEVDNERHLWSFEENDLKELLAPYGRVWTRKMGSDYFPLYKYHFPTLLAFCAKT